MTLRKKKLKVEDIKPEIHEKLQAKHAPKDELMEIAKELGHEQLAAAWEAVKPSPIIIKDHYPVEYSDPGYMIPLFLPNGDFWMHMIVSKEVRDKYSEAVEQSKKKK